MRSAVAARFLTLRVLTDSTLPPLILLSGQSLSQEPSELWLMNTVTRNFRDI